MQAVGEPRIGMVAGEASGDMLAAMLLRGLQVRWPSIEAQGIGGPQMVAAGFEPWWPQERLAVRGYVEVLRHYRALSAIRRTLAQRLIQHPPKLFIGVDAPDFNLGLEATLRAAGIATVHFICPSIWAWRGQRVQAIKRSVDHMLCLFPFEPALLAAHGIESTFVGHPLADVIDVVAPPKAAVRARLGLPPEGPLVALLPGSRSSEVAAMGALFLAAARHLHDARPDVHFVLPVAPGRRVAVDALVRAEARGARGAGADRPLPLTVLDGQSHAALAACDVTIIASGTATLEAALFKKPMVIAYRMNPISYQLMKRMGYQPWIGLPNILAREFLVPERIQGAATPKQLADDTLAWLDAPRRIDALTVRFTDMHLELRRDTARTATDAIERYLAR